MRKRPVLLEALLVLVFMVVAMAAGEYRRAFSWEQDPQWRQVHLSGTDSSMPIRLVGYDEPWEQVVQDVHARLGSIVSERDVRIEFYGHGAFVKGRNGSSLAQLEPRRQGNLSVGKLLGDAVCEQIQRLDPAGVCERP